MKLRVILVVILTISVFSASFSNDVEKKYSIQVISTKSIKEAKSYYEKFKEYPFTRVEKINNYFVLRVGISKTVKSLKDILKKVKKIKKDAFVRTVYILPDRIIISNFRLNKKTKTMKKTAPKYIKKTEELKKNLAVKQPAEKKEIIKKKNVKDIFSVIPSYKKVKKNTNKSEKKVSIKKKQKVKFEPYIILSLGLVKIDKEKINKTLKKYGNILPYKDKLQAEIITGRIGKAYKTSFRNLNNSFYDYLAYKQSRELYVNYSNRFKSNLFYEYINDIKKINLSWQLKKYIYKGFYFYLDNINNLIVSYDNNIYKNLSNNDNTLLLGVNKIFDSSNIKIKVGFRKSQKIFPVLLCKYKFKNNKYFTSTLSLGVNYFANISNQLFYGGVKDFVNYNYNIAVNSKNIISGDLSFNRYYTQDRKYKGNGVVFNINYLHKYRVGYPDFSSYVYINTGFFNEKTGNFGTLAKILKQENYLVIPDNFLEGGIGFSFGFDYLETYTRQIRPFLDTNINYNIVYGVGYSIFSGLGGKVFNEDNLALGISFGKGFSGQPYTIYRLQIFYKKWF